MTKDKLNINFHEKETNLLEARLYLYGLRFGIVNLNLNEEENREYIKRLNFEKNRNELAKKIGKSMRKELTERAYLIESLENKIVSTKIERNKIYCKKYGHKEDKKFSYTSSGVEGAVTHYICPRCGTVYKEGANLPKDEDPNKKIHNPFRG